MDQKEERKTPKCQKWPIKMVDVYVTINDGIFNIYPTKICKTN